MNTSTGLVAVIPAYLQKDGETPEATAIDSILNLVENCQEIVRAIVITTKGHRSLSLNIKNPHRVWLITEEPQNNDFPFLIQNIDRCVSDFEKKEGEEIRYIFLANPWFSNWNEITVMECFQRLMIDGLAHGVEPERKKWEEVPNFALWRRETLKELMESHDELRFIPYHLS